jgi:hypothetical protein
MMYVNINAQIANIHYQLTNIIEVSKIYLVLRLVEPWYELGMTSSPYYAGIGMRLALPHVSTRRYWYEVAIAYDIPVWSAF